LTSWRCSISASSPKAKNIMIFSKLGKIRNSEKINREERQEREV